MNQVIYIIIKIPNGNIEDDNILGYIGQEIKFYSFLNSLLIGKIVVDVVENSECNGNIKFQIIFGFVNITYLQSFPYLENVTSNLFDYPWISQERGFSTRGEEETHSIP